MPKVSVIIPVYNASQYLGECLDSITSQSLEDIEIICVNDGSTDNSLALLNEYVKKDSRIVVINQKNSGAGAARNKGLEVAKGEYIQFVDADDYLLPEMLETCVDTMTNNDVDVAVFFRHKTLQDKNIKCGDVAHNFPNGVFNTKEYVSLSFSFLPNIHQKFYKRSYIEKYNLKFDNLKTCNDVYFSYISIVLASRIIVIPNILYVYREDSCGNISSSRNKYAKNIILAFSHIKKDLKNNKLFNLYKNNYYCALFSHLNYEAGLCNKNQKIFLSLNLWKYEFAHCLLEFLKKTLPSLFSVKNYRALSGTYHKIITILGIKIKIKNDKRTTNEKLLNLENRINNLQRTANNVDRKYQKLLNCYSHGVNKEKVNYEIESFNSIGVTSEKRDKKLIVSLTSYPDRMYDIHYTIYSLLNQTVKPDEIILWLAEEQFENKLLPEVVLNFQKAGLTIKWCEDLKSYKKLIPALKEYPNDIIVTADDDIYYPNNWLETLYEEYKNEPTLIHAKRCHKFDFNIPYNKWKHCVFDNSITFRNFCTTGGGVLYPPNSLHSDVLNTELFKALAPNADDIWFWAMALLKGTKIKVCEDATTKLIYTTPEREFGLYEEQTLFSSNGGQGGNDFQLKQVLEYYPQLEEILKND